MGEEFEKHLGEMADIGIRRPNGGVFFVRAKLEGITETHLFVKGQHGTEAIALSEIARIQFSNSAEQGGDRHE